MTSDKRFLTVEQVERLARASGQYELLVRFLSYTGLRWGEVAALRWRNVDLDRPAGARCRGHDGSPWPRRPGTPKNHQRRTVPVPAFLIRELKAATTGRQPDDLVFPAPEGGCLRNGNFRGSSQSRV